MDKINPEQPIRKKAVQQISILVCMYKDGNWGIENEWKPKSRQGGVNIAYNF